MIQHIAHLNYPINIIVRLALIGFSGFVMADHNESSKLNSFQHITGKGYRIKIPQEWVQTSDLPYGVDVGFSKTLENGEKATFFFHYETMPPEAGSPPPDTSAMQNQWDAMLKNKYHDIKKINDNIPKVNGRVLINATYELMENGTKLWRRYTYFLNGQTAFVVQCSTSPTEWKNVLPEFDEIISTLLPSDTAPVTEAASDASVIARLKNDLPTLLATFPTNWMCSLQDVSIEELYPDSERILRIELYFFRKDIQYLYKATKLIFVGMAEGNADDDLTFLPAELRGEASNCIDFIQHIGQVLGCAFAFSTNCMPPIEQYRIAISDSDEKAIGSISISREDGSIILSDKVNTIDIQQIAKMYKFDIHDNVRIEAKNESQEPKSLAESIDAEKATTKLKVLSESLEPSDITQIHELIKAGADVNVRNTTGSTLLWEASAKGYTEIVKLLLDAKADVNTIDNTNRATPLFVACNGGYAETVQLLLGAGADVNARKIGGSTPLFAALLKGNNEIVKLLLEAKANVNIRMKGTFTPLLLSVLNGHTEVVKLLLEKNANVNAKILLKDATYRILNIVETGKNTEIIQLLKDAGAEKYFRAPEQSDTNIDITLSHTDTKGKVEYTNWTEMGTRYFKDSDIRLLIAAKDGDIFSLKKALIEGASPNFMDEDERSVLLWAALSGRSEIVKHLLGVGVDVNASDKDDNTPLSVAIVNGHSEVVGLLLQAGANVNAADMYDTTPLIMASHKGYTDIVKILLKTKINVNVTTIDGMSALWVASQKGHSDIVKLLLEYGANINAARYADGGTTPLWQAAGNGHMEIVKLLLETGADMYAADTNGINPLMIASYAGQSEVVHLLNKYGAKEEPLERTNTHEDAPENENSGLDKKMARKFESEIKQRSEDELKKDLSLKSQNYHDSDRDNSKKIEGIIIQVDKDKALVSISIGSSAGVKKGDCLHVIRRDKFVCNIVITTLSPNVSVGTLSSILSRPEVGDMVTNKLE